MSLRLWVMDLDLCNSFPAACVVWDSADVHLISAYSFSITHFGGIKGQAIFSHISICTLQHTFTHPKGLLFTIQFSQIGLVVTSRAAFEDMHSKSLVQPGTPLLATHQADSLPLLSLEGTLTRYRALTAALWLDKGYDSRPSRLDKLRVVVEKSGWERKRQDNIKSQGQETQLGVLGTPRQGINTCQDATMSS